MPLEPATGTPVLRSERLTLRRFAWSDLDDLIDLHNDPAVMHYLNNGQPVPRGSVADELSVWIGAYEPSDRFGFWATNESTTGRFLGWMHFRPGEGAGCSEPELGFRLRRSCWGQGLATEASVALVDRGFDEPAVDRVYAHTMSVHRASRRVLEKAGLRLIRTFRADWPVRIPGDEYGDVEYALTRAQWSDARSTMES